MKPVSNEEGMLFAVLIRKTHTRKSTGRPRIGLEDNVQVGTWKLK
jgi:hypothetical protein